MFNVFNKRLMSLADGSIKYVVLNVSMNLLCLPVSHRGSTMQIADTVYGMDRGRVS